MNNIYVLYHAHCTDGTGSKFAAWKKYGNAATYIPVQYGRPVPKMEPGSEIYILDFSYPRDVLDKLRSVHASVMVLDHHKSAEEALRGCPGCTFDMNRSGCVMAWNHFHPGKEIPAVLQNVQDRDLWRFRMADSKAVHAGLQLLQGNMDEWNQAASNVKAYHKLIEKGQILLAAQEIAVASAVRSKVKVIDFQGYKVGVTNTTDHASEIGSAICESKDHNVDFAMPYCITNNNEVLLSLRSIGDFDVSVIAQQFGGGGHKNAAGARISIAKLAEILG